MSTQDKGGPAFPCPPVNFKDADGSTKLDSGAIGMTLRDYFAGCALSGFLSSADTLKAIKVVADNNSFAEPEHAAARMSYDYADAMLAARKEGAK